MNKNIDFTDLIPQAEQGDAEAQYKLGMGYLDRRSNKEDYQEAYKWLTRAAEQDHAESMYQLGAHQAMFASRGLVSGTSEELQEQKMDWYHRAHKLGHKEAGYRICKHFIDTGDFEEARLWLDGTDMPKAQYELGELYAQGKGGDQDYGKAVDMYRKAAEQGYRWAQTALGECYYYGLGVKPDNKQAIAWHYKACEAREEDCGPSGYQEYELAKRLASGKGLPQNLNEAFKMFQASANLGYRNAFRKVAECYLSGQGVNKDESEAVSWYKRGAEQRDGLALEKLGECYYYGRGVAKDDQEAISWYEKAVDEQGVEGMLMLAKRYEAGDGIAKDPQAAEEWYRKALEEFKDSIGDYPALEADLLGEYYYYGRGVAKDEKEALACYEKAAELGGPLGWYYLGERYAKGNCIAQDYGKAAECFFRAANGGIEPAMCALGKLYENGLGVELNKEKAFDWYNEAAGTNCPQAFTALGKLREWLSERDNITGEDYKWQTDGAIECYREGAALGDAEAQCRLGAMYLHKAKMLFRMAADNGNIEAQRALDCVSEERVAN